MAGLNIGALPPAGALADDDMLEIERPDGDPGAEPPVPNSAHRITLADLKAEIGTGGDSYEPGDVLITAREPGEGWLEQGKLYLQSEYPEVFNAVGLIGDGAPGTVWESMTPTTALPATPTAMVHVRDRILVATVSNEVYRTTDGGVTWTLVSSPTGSKFQLAHLGSSVLLAGGLSGFLVRSDDAGLTWTQITSGTTNGIPGFIRFNDARVLALSNPSRLSTDAGLTWSTASGLPFNATNGVALTSSIGIATTGGSSTSIYRTTNGGQNWTTVTVPHGSYSTGGLNFGNGIAVLFGTTAMIRTTDFGLTWNTVTLPALGNMRSGTLTGADEAVIATSGVWVFSGDRGATWGFTTGQPTAASPVVENIPGDYVLAIGNSAAQARAFPDYSYNTATHFRAPRIALATEWLKGYIKA